MAATGALSLLMHRLVAAFTTWPDAHQWAVSALLLLLFALVAAPVGFATGFVRLEPVRSRRTMARLLIATLLFPAIVEEAIFRVALLPRPSEGAPPEKRLLLGAAALFLYVAAHLLRGFGAQTARSALFRDPTFLLLTTLLGSICTAAYVVSRSIWAPAAIHWFVVFVWLGLLGGYGRVRPRRSPSGGAI